MTDAVLPDSTSPGLSPAGRARREAMLHELTRRMERVHRRRRAGRTALAAVALAVVAAGAIQLARPAAGPDRAPVVATDTTPVDPPRVDLRIVQSDPAILERYAVAPRSSAIVLDDESLLEALAALDRPAGLIRRDGTVWLTAEVADSEL